MSFTKLDYCQYLLSSQVNYTLTNMAEHLQKFSHDTINRYLKAEKLSPRLLREQVQSLLELDPEAHLIFDDTVLEKSFGPKIEVVRKQWSGNKKGMISGIGVVSYTFQTATPPSTRAAGSGDRSSSRRRSPRRRRAPSGPATGSG